MDSDKSNKSQPRKMVKFVDHACTSLIKDEIKKTVIKCRKESRFKKVSYARYRDKFLTRDLENTEKEPKTDQEDVIATQFIDEFNDLDSDLISIFEELKVLSSDE